MYNCTDPSGSFYAFPETGLSLPMRAYRLRGGPISPEAGLSNAFHEADPRGKGLNPVPYTLTSQL